MEFPTTPVKGTQDWLPDEFAIRNYIFSIWRKINQQFGYQEYLTPILENADLYRAKSGDDVGGHELMIMVDRAGRELAIRPEMTPSVTRLVTSQYKQLPKPVRFFSIANFLRNEKPQRGRNREFWQLNTDIFGSDSFQSEIEILQIALEIMFAFNAPPESFKLSLNHRSLINFISAEVFKFSPEKNKLLMQLLDKYSKLDQEKRQAYIDQLDLDTQQQSQLHTFINAISLDQLTQIHESIAYNPGYQQLKEILDQLTSLGYQANVQFNPTIVRGLDYYDGMVFEVFDKHPDNNRAMFGGGRYNGLGQLFGNESIPAVGFAPGDETTRLFLASWNLIPHNLLPSPTIYIPLIISKAQSLIQQQAKSLRQSGTNVLTGLETTSIRQALNYANKQNIPFVVLIGESEINQNQITVKNMKTGDQSTISPDLLLDHIR